MKLFLKTTLAGIAFGMLMALIVGCIGVKFSVNFSKQNSNLYPEKTMAGTVSGRSLNPKEFKDILTYLGFEVFDKKQDESK